MASCGECVWWHGVGVHDFSVKVAYGDGPYGPEFPEQLDLGECRERPPTAVKVKGSTFAFGWYPTVSKDFPSCREWMPCNLFIERPATDEHGEPR